MKKTKIDKILLTKYNEEERYEMKNFIKRESVNHENLYENDEEFLNTTPEEISQKQILYFKTRLKHFQNYTRITLHCILMAYILTVLFIVPVLAKLRNSSVKVDRRSSVLSIQGSLIVFIHSKLLLTDTGMPGISNSQRVTKNQSKMIHGLTYLLVFGLILKNYNNLLMSCMYVFPLLVFATMLVFFQYWCYQTENEIESLVELNYEGKLL